MASMMQEHEWLVKHHSEVEKFAGEWVAIVDRSVVAHGKNFQLARKVATKKYPGKTPMVFYVPKKDEELLIV